MLSMIFAVMCIVALVVWTVSGILKLILGVALYKRYGKGFKDVEIKITTED